MTTPKQRLVLGPSIGTTVATCWGAVISLLSDEFDVVPFELPGHGADAAPVPETVTTADLAVRVLDSVEGPFLYAGDSIGGQIGLQLLLDAPDRVLGAALCCTGAKIGDASMWAGRMEQVRTSGPASLVSATAERWFAPGFLEREPERSSALLRALADTSEAGYLAMCSALATFDVRDRLGEISAPVVAVAGAEDLVCPVEGMREVAEGVQHGRLVVLSGVAHQAAAEAPERVAEIIRELAQEVAA